MGAVPVRIPCVGWAITAKLSKSPSWSEPVRVIDSAVSSGVVTD